jgi:uncharacterized cupin superfamily protein
VTAVANLYDTPRVQDGGAPTGYAAPCARIGPLVGASALGLTVYELAEGQSICPYHYEYPCEEWVIVLEGAPTLRTPEGESELEPGDVVGFPPGPAGAHKLTNRRAAPALVAMLSTKSRPAVAVYPDSGKLGVLAGEDEALQVFPRAAAVGYWEGEA